jgi:ribosomal protein S18 acetylase RimI-like enzyme
MTRDDVEAVAALAGRLVRIHHAFDPARFVRRVASKKEYAEWLGSLAGASDVIVLVAERSSGASGGRSRKIVGYVYARLEPPSHEALLGACAKLHDVYVDDTIRGFGIGEALVRETIRRAADRGAPRLVLMTAAKNESAQRLFARIGFRPTMVEMTRETGRADLSPPQA